MQSANRTTEVETLVEAHYASLYRFAYRLSRSAADAEDLTQQTFLTAYEKLDQLRMAEHAQAWLFTILRNAYLKTRRGPTVTTELPMETIVDPSETPDPPTDFDADDLTRALDELPEEFRLPLVLFYFEDLSYRDIAAALDLPIGTVMSRLSRGKTHLRSRLAEHHPVASG